MQKGNISILSTRLLDESIMGKASDANITIDSFSFIRTEAVHSEELKEKLQSLAKESLCAVFTSLNAVTAVAEYISGFPDWKVFCTGGRTKEITIQTFGETAVIASAKNAGLLAERIIASGRIAKVTFFCGDQRLNELPEKLSQAHIQTEEVIVYTTVLTPVAVEKDYSGVLFFSPSAVHSFFSLNTLPVDVVLFSIGQTTTAAIQAYCTNKVITSDWPGTESLLACVTDFYNTASQEVDQTIS